MCVLTTKRHTEIRKTVAAKQNCVDCGLFIVVGMYMKRKGGSTKTAWVVECSLQYAPDLSVVTPAPLGPGRPGQVFLEAAEDVISKPVQEHDNRAKQNKAQPTRGYQLTG